ncbi:hypothetical protein D3C78_927310 [compost metagenome]
MITVETSRLMARPALKDGLRNSARHTSGASTRDSTQAKSPTPQAAVSSRMPLSAPKWPWPRVMASAYAASVSASTSVPTASKAALLRGVRGRSTGKYRQASNRLMMPSGTLIRKIACQPTLAINTPPRDGPNVVPSADIDPSKPMALPVRAWGTVSATKATVRAIMIAAPRPCTARAAISQPSVDARPHASEAPVKMPIPASSTRRRPIKSPSRPTLTIKVVMASR